MTTKAEEFEQLVARYEEKRREAFRTNDPADFLIFEDARKALIDCAVDNVALIDKHSPPREPRPGEIDEYMRRAHAESLATESKACKIHEGDHSLTARKWCCTHLQWDCAESKPREDRPAKTDLLYISGQNWSAEDALAEVVAKGFAAVVEAIDAQSEKPDKAVDKLELILGHALSIFEGVMMRNAR